MLFRSSTGFKVMGWQVDPATGNIIPDVVSALQVMNKDNLTVGAESTTRAYASGILDKNDTNANSPAGKTMTLHFYDNLGYDYTAKLSIHSLGTDGRYRVKLDDIIDADQVSLVKKYNLSNIEQIASFGNDQPPRIITNKYGMNSNSTYDSATQSYTVNYSNADILKDYDESAMIKAAGNTATIAGKDDGNGNITAINANDAIKTGDLIAVKGNVTLTKSQLEKEPYNLILDNGQYYAQKLGADGKPELDANGNPTRQPDPLGTDPDKWQAALQAMQGMSTVKVSTVQLDGTDVKIEFTQTFEVEKDATFTGTAFGVTLDGKDPANQDAILDQVYNLTQGTDGKTFSIDFVSPSGEAQISSSEDNSGFELIYDVDNGDFISINGGDSATLTFNPSAASVTGDSVSLTHFSNIDIDFTSTTMLNNGKVSTIGADPGAGDEANTGIGRKYGELIGIEVGQDGKITASYDNGISKLLGQIAVANFANAAGLSKAGNNLYSATMNSGEFDGVGSDITADGGTMESGVLEMSNVDLSAEFTEMITTQRGFQANSRIITTSDSLLEELVNLKR